MKATDKTVSAPLTIISIALGDQSATEKLGAALAKKAHLGDFFALIGPLGAGKSTFARGFIRALCGPETEVPSPTFTLLQQYDSPKGQIFHYDLYRLEDPHEIWELDFENALAEIALVEWPDRAGDFLPARRATIQLDFATDFSENGAASIGRSAHISLYGAWGKDWSISL